MITTIYISEMEAANTSTTSQDPEIFSTPNNFDNLSAKKWKSKTLEKAQGKWIHIKGKIFLFISGEKFFWALPKLVCREVELLPLSILLTLTLKPGADGSPAITQKPHAHFSDNA